ncbi:MAG: tetratricopeptide repeat protein [Pseudomonadota bacterium]
MVRFSRLAIIGAAVSVLAVGGAAFAAGGGGGGGGDMPGATGPQYDPVAEYQKGVAALQAGKWKEAERAFGHVTQVAPRAPEAWFMLGYARAGGGDLKGARKAYEKAAKLKPDDIDTRRELGITLARLGETERARAELEALRARQTACAGACAEAAALKTSVAALEAALAPPAAAGAPPARPTSSLRLVDPAAGDGAYLAAVGLINEKRWSEALAALDEAGRAFGPHPDILTYRGYVLRRQGRLDAAETWYRAALAIDPDHRGATEYYGELKVIRGDIAGARKMLARLDGLCVYGCPEAEELRRWIEAGGQPL